MPTLLFTNGQLARVLNDPVGMAEPTVVVTSDKAEPLSVTSLLEGAVACHCRGERGARSGWSLGTRRAAVSTRPCLQGGMDTEGHGGCRPRHVDTL